MTRVDERWGLVAPVAAPVNISFIFLCEEGNCRRFDCRRDGGTMGGWILLVESRVLLCSDVMMVGYPSNPHMPKENSTTVEKKKNTFDCPHRYG